MSIFSRARMFSRWKLFNKHYWKVVGSALTGHPFDYAYLYYIIYDKMVEMREYFKRPDHIVVDEENNKIVWSLDVCIKLLGIWLHEEVDPHVYVNLRNVHRFYDDNDKISVTLAQKYPDNYYKDKALQIFHRYFKHYSVYWWD